MPSGRFAALVALWAVSSAGFNLASRNYTETAVAQPLIGLVATTTLLLFFAARGHRWPKWMLAALLAGAVVIDFVTFDARMLFLISDSSLLALWIVFWRECRQPVLDGGA